MNPARIHRFDYNPPELVHSLIQGERRVLLFGPSGIGKTTLADRLGAAIHAADRQVCYLGADPGSPHLGVPGALSLARWADRGWSVHSLSATCTLDAARFRMPLALAAADLASRITGTLIVDTPGVVRGVAGAELLDALVRLTAVDLVLVLTRDETPVHLHHELDSLDVEVAHVRASELAHQPNAKARAVRRTRLWDTYLAVAEVKPIARDGLALVGTPPRDAPEAWQGKQVAFLDGGRTTALGEVRSMDAAWLHVLMPVQCEPTRTLLVRDAQRGEDGLVTTSKHFAANLVHYVPPPDTLSDDQGTISGPRPVVQLANALACLMNGVLGDPLLHLRLGQERRSLLFDLGDGARLPARIAHQLTDVFISHAHADHISGFVWLIRLRIGETPPLRLYGPPGLCEHLKGFIDGIRWDRIADHGPRFDIIEVHGTRLIRYHLQAGINAVTLEGEVEAVDHVLLDEIGFRISYRVLDHGIPVLGFSYETPDQLTIRKDRLAERGLAPGPWLAELKERLAAGDDTAHVRLPSGDEEQVAALAKDLVRVIPGVKMAYATDFADTAENRGRVVELAKDAHTLFCESTFLEEASEQARSTGHLTTRACAEIANAANVSHLIPFHFSRRYECDPWRVYNELAKRCPNTVLPRL